MPQEELAEKIAAIVKENKKLKSGKKRKELAAEELKSSEFKIEKHNGQIKLYENASLEMLEDMLIKL